MEQQQQQHSRTPTDFLNSVIGREVLVKLNSGIDYKGKRYLLIMIIYYTRSLPDQ
jgi:hypothetical protein